MPALVAHRNIHQRSPGTAGSREPVPSVPTHPGAVRLIGVGLLLLAFATGSSVVH